MNDEEILDSIRRGNRTSKDIARDTGRPTRLINTRLASLTKYNMVSRRKYRVRKSGQLQPSTSGAGSCKYVYTIVE